MSLSSASLQSLKRSRLLFSDDHLEEGFSVKDDGYEKLIRVKLQTKIRDEYAHSMLLPPSIQQTSSESNQLGIKDDYESNVIGRELDNMVTTATVIAKPVADSGSQSSVVLRNSVNASFHQSSAESLKIYQDSLNEKPSIVDADTRAALVRSHARASIKPKSHAEWKLKTVLSGHLGWVRSVTVDTSNEWFATGSSDRLIKIWDLASGTLKLSLTGHIGAVRGLAVSDRHPYLFSAGEDKQVKCWDLECNKVVRHYHGHLSAVYSLALHPTLDVLISGGRDSVARVWDMRTRNCVHILSGHSDTVASVIAQEADPQVITGSHDSTIKLWDLAAGKSITTLTHHKKSIRAIAGHPREFTFASASPDAIKQWKLPEGKFIQNLSGHKAIVNTLAINEDDVLFSGGDDGTMKFWDWKSGHCYQTMNTTVHPGSLETEAGIFCSTFDKSGTRLITGEADKSIKIWWQDHDNVSTKL